MLGEDPTESAILRATERQPRIVHAIERSRRVIRWLAVASDARASRRRAVAEVHARLVDVKRELAQLGADGALGARRQTCTSRSSFSAASPRTRSTRCARCCSTRCATTAPMAAQVRGLGAFPDLRRPRVVWAGVECAPLAGARGAPSTRRLAPHRLRAGDASVPRPRHARPRQRHARLDAVGRDLRRAPARTSAPALRRADRLSQRLAPDGALYTTLWSIPFGG